MRRGIHKELTKTGGDQKIPRDWIYTLTNQQGEWATPTSRSAITGFDLTCMKKVPIDVISAVYSPTQNKSI